MIAVVASVMFYWYWIATCCSLGATRCSGILCRSIGSFLQPPDLRTLCPGIRGVPSTAAFGDSIGASGFSG